MDHAKAAATIHQTGGGTGMTYEFLRPSGAMVEFSYGRCLWSSVVHEHRQSGNRRV